MPIPDYVRFEIERRIIPGYVEDREILKLGKRHDRDLAGATAPDDAREAAASLTPLDRDRPIYRGAVEFTTTVVVMDCVHRRKCRMLYAATLGDEGGRRGIHSMVSGTQVVLWDENDLRFVWTDFPEEMLPEDATWAMMDLVEADAVAQEQAQGG